MIDHHARTQLCQAIDQWLSQPLDHSRLEKAIFRLQTDDATVRRVQQMLIATSDDFDERPIFQDKRKWDSVQRMKLLLASGAELHVNRHRIRHASQRLALETLASMASSAASMSAALPVAMLSGGVVSVWLSRWRARSQAALEHPDPFRAWPFPSLGAVREAMHRAPGFRKQRYRPPASPSVTHFWWAHYHLGDSIEWFANNLMLLVAAPVLLLFSPMLLLAQCFPLRSVTYDVTFPEAETAT